MRLFTVIFFSCAMFQGFYGESSHGRNSSLARDKRHLLFPPPVGGTPSKIQFILGLGLPMEVDVSLIIGYVLKLNFILPYNASDFTMPYVRYDRSINHNVQLHQDDLPLDNEGHVTSRWELYEILERTLRSGKACLLRAICELAATPFHRCHGLTSQLLHTFLTPSTTTEPFRTAFDREYRAAEMAGRIGERTCYSLFPECPENYLDYFTDLHE